MARFLCLCASFLVASFLFAQQANCDEFRGKWWHYYQRGMGYTDDKKLDEAVKDLKKAINMRDKDQRMARTYGMHFIDYFPHRELGIALLEKGDLDSALRELEESVRSAESAKGVYYLNAARKAKITGSKRTLASPLTVSFQKPAEKVITGDRSLRVEAVVTSDDFVSRVTVNGIAYPVEEAKRKVIVRQEVPLEDDTKEIRVMAEDLAGNRTAGVLPVSVKRQGPVLTITSIGNEVRDQKNYARVLGQVHDDVGIQSVRVGGREVNANGARSYTIDLLVERKGAETLLVRVGDIVGNETVADVDLSAVIAAEAVAHLSGSRAALERQALEAAEKERVALEAAEKARLARESAEKVRLAKEAAEKDRQAQAQAERERAALERAEQERLATSAAESARQAALAALAVEHERAAAEAAALQLAAQGLERERQARVAAERTRLARERAEQEELARQNAQAELKLRQAAQKAEAERVAREEAERLRVEAEKAEQQRQAREVADRIRQAREKAEQEEQASLRDESERQARIVAQKAEAERIAREETARLRIAAAKAEQERLAREAEESVLLAREKAQKDHLEKLAREADERSRLVREEAQKDELARQKAEAERQVLLAAQRAESDRQAREEAERQRIAAEESEKERQAKEASERIRMAREKLQQEEQARAEAEKENLARLAAEKAQAERVAREETQRLRIAAEKAELERQARALAESARLEREKGEREELARQQAEAELKARQAAEKAQAERVARETEIRRVAAEKAEQDRLAKEAAERARLARVKLEQEEQARQKAEAQRQVRLAAEKAEAERVAREDAEHNRLAAQKAEKERQAREEAERKRLAKEQAEQENLARLRAEAARKAYQAGEQADAEERAAGGTPGPAAGQQPIIVERDKLKAITDEQKLGLALSTDSDKQVTPGNIASGEGTRVYTPSAAGREGGERRPAPAKEASVCKKPDRQNPILNIKDTSDIPFVFVDAYPLDGLATDNCLVDRVLVNGRDLSIRKGKQVYFSNIVKLNSGENSITVEVVDGSGNKSRSEIHVTRKIPSVLQNGSRMSVLVLPFDYDGAASNSMHQASDYLIGAMAEQHRFMVVERQKLKKLMEERKMSLALAEDNEQAAKFGKIAAAEAIIVNTARETDHSFEVTSRIVDTETSEVMSVLDVYTEDVTNASVKTLMTALAAKIARNFPVVEGIVISRSDDQVMTDLGTPQMVRQRTGAIIYRKGKEIKHPVTGKSLGFDTEKLGEGYIDEVQESFSKLKLGDRYRDRAIRPSDLVVTK